MNIRVTTSARPCRRRNLPSWYVTGRKQTIDRLPTVPALVVADLSFISLTKVMDVLAGIVVPVRVGPLDL